jgi:hypothetical protein
VALFLVFIPVVLLYSIGYRLDKGFTLKSTGGLYVFYPESGAKVYLNDELTDQTSIFGRGIFIDNLQPTSYKVQIQKEGYLPWDKNVNVVEKKVVEAYPFLIPEVVSTSSVPKFVTLGSGASVTNTLYGEVVKLFATSTSSSVTLKKVLASTSTTLVASSTGIIRKDIEIDIVDKAVIASWKGSIESTPFYFCDVQRLDCKKELKVVEGTFKHVDFYPGRNDVIIYSTNDGIYATELDQRLPVNTHKLISGNLEFRENDNRVFIKDKSNYFELIFTASTTLNNSISI